MAKPDELSHPPENRVPKLSVHVQPRRYVSGGEDSIVLYDQRGGAPHVVTVEDWRLISSFDGSKDIEALASETGPSTTTERIAQLVSALEERDLLEDPDAGEAGPHAEASAQAPLPDKPVEALPDFALACDGRGSCCRLQSTIKFSAAEAALARARLPVVLDCGSNPDRIFSPLSPGNRDSLAVTVVDGSCAFLGANRLCGIHAAAGADKKPLLCRTFPTRLVDVGDRVVVTPLLECACVFRSAVLGAPGGSPLVQPRLRFADIGAGIRVQTVPDQVHVAPGHFVERGEFAAWTHGLESLRYGDAIAGLLALESSLHQHGLDLTASARAVESPPVAKAGSLEEGVDAFSERLQPLLATWRSDRDLVRQAAIALERACHHARANLPGLVERTGPQADAEAFYLRAHFFGATFAMGSPRPLTSVLRDHALRLLLARACREAMASAAGEPWKDEPAFEWPIAIVSALIRSFGVGSYLRAWPELVEAEMAAFFGGM